MGAQLAGFAAGAATVAAIVGRSLVGWLMPAGGDRRVLACASYGAQIIGSLTFLLAGGRPGLSRPGAATGSGHAVVGGSPHFAASNRSRPVSPLPIFSSRSPALTSRRIGSLLSFAWMIAVLRTVEGGGVDAVHIGDGRGDARLELGDGGLGVGHRGRLNAGQAGDGALGAVGGHLDLAREGMHVRREARLAPDMHPLPREARLEQG
eukprot:gene57017-78131_t